MVKAGDGLLGLPQMSIHMGDTIYHSSLYHMLLLFFGVGYQYYRNLDKIER